MTYGPWHAETGINAVYALDGTLVCTVIDDETARFIAASPDLYAALTEALQAMESSCSPGIIAAARMAIKKATP